MLIACWKTNFFECSWVIFERGTEKEKFSGWRGFQTKKQKVIFYTVLRSKSNIFLQYPLGIVEKHAKKKQVCCWLKIWRASRKKCEVLNTHSNVHFSRKVPIFRACKNAKFALQHPIVFGVLASPWTTLKTEKRKFACSWEIKSVSGRTPLIWVFGHFWLFRTMV